MHWNDETFTAVFDSLYPGVCQYLERMLGRSGAAQEVAQEAFLRLYRAGARRVAPGEERFWVYRVATNLALNELRRARTRERLSGVLAFLIGRRLADPYQDAERAERDRQLRDALERLPGAHRAALLLREQEDLSYSEIADVLGVSLEKVKVDIFRARSALRAVLANTTDDSGQTPHAGCQKGKQPS